jgi:hypothetical protein
VVQGQGYRTALYPAGQTGSERFHRALQSVLPAEVLGGWLFTSLDEVREIAYQWLQSYNQERPHDALGSLSPSCVPRETACRGKLYFSTVYLTGKLTESRSHVLEHSAKYVVLNVLEYLKGEKIARKFGGRQKPPMRAVWAAVFLSTAKNIVRAYIRMKKEVYLCIPSYYWLLNSGGEVSTTGFDD